jgi:hypothetical protein
MKSKTLALAACLTIIASAAHAVTATFNGFLLNGGEGSGFGNFSGSFTILGDIPPLLSAPATFSASPGVPPGGPIGTGDNGNFFVGYEARGFITGARGDFTLANGALTDGASNP